MRSMNELSKSDVAALATGSMNNKRNENVIKITITNTAAIIKIKTLIMFIN